MPHAETGQSEAGFFDNGWCTLIFPSHVPLLAVTRAAVPTSTLLLVYLDLTHNVWGQPWGRDSLFCCAFKLRVSSAVTQWGEAKHHDVAARLHPPSHNP